MNAPDAKKLKFEGETTIACREASSVGTKQILVRRKIFIEKEKIFIVDFNRQRYISAPSTPANIRNSYENYYKSLDRISEC